ncbi:TetR/AcrR family transcriptional regulator [Siculibacillus lacustris]|uniref:TetR/AcrR family transcriptional regulator n=1 Tax=Siculibacillus lacustris TaxID=1549641 RepID=UPI0013F1741F|nr:TetR/AcrR family transcriptional regulator [Siculibacillus lacustris]
MSSSAESSRPALTRRAWIDEARRVLVDKGVGEIKIDALARRLAVTRGSFYWHFAARDDLLDALLDDWRDCALAPFARVVAEVRGRPERRLLAYFEVWLDTARYDPDHDAAVRDWARGSAAVDAAVRAVDGARIAGLATLFAELGCSAIEAEVRARIVYYHQVGYYALRIAEPDDLRRRLLPTYFRVLTGVDMPADDDPHNC